MALLEAGQKEAATAGDSSFPKVHNQGGGVTINKKLSPFERK